MIIVKLLGGLGNQMFQYAFGRALAMQKGCEVKYDTKQLLDHSTELGYTTRNYELDVFTGKVDLAKQSELRIFEPAPRNPMVGIPFKIYRRLKGVQCFSEKMSFGYDPTVFACAPDTYFEGYWQNECYFKPYEVQIRQALALKKPLTGRNLSLAQRIEQTPVAVSLHVRRGDYISNAQAYIAHGICTPRYYAEAIQAMKSQVGAIELFIFSDEPEWVQANMQFDVPTTYISHNDSSAAEDLRLMSLCSHNIIANSSFSWWGAWLNSNSTKLVIAPKQWMQLDTIDSSGLIPSDWLTL